MDQEIFSMYGGLKWVDLDLCKIFTVHPNKALLKREDGKYIEVV